MKSSSSTAQGRRFSKVLAGGLALVLSCWLSAPTAWAQVKKIPPPEDVDLKDKFGTPLSKDGILLKATWFPGTKGKDTVPVILLHGLKGSRAEYAELGKFLQEQGGHAVLVPDLRWHGESTTALGGQRTLDPDRLPPDQYKRMVLDDVEACKKFLMDKNNAGLLNIDKLVIVGAEMGAVVAMNWALWDWHWPPLTTGKQGQDVKALVLLSPDWTAGPLNMNAAATDRAMQRQLSVYLVYGSKKSSAARDAKRLYNALERFHSTEGDQIDLFVNEVPTSLQGTKLLTVPNLGLENLITVFIDATMARKSLPWRDRTGPLN